jgi:hypothetical protein
MRVDKVTGMTSLLYIHLIRFLQRTHKQRGIFGSCCEMSASQRSQVFWDVTVSLGAWFPTFRRNAVPHLHGQAVQTQQLFLDCVSIEEKGPPYIGNIGDLLTQRHRHTSQKTWLLSNTAVRTSGSNTSVS